HDAGLFRDIRESSVAVVTVKDVSAEASNVEIGPAIVLVISDCAAHGKARCRDSGFVGDIRKRSVVIVVIEGAASFLSFDGHVYGRRVGKVNVQPAVAVVIDQQHTAAHGFDDIFAFWGGSV